jgi:hypothetical protein
MTYRGRVDDKREDSKKENRKNKKQTKQNKTKGYIRGSHVPGEGHEFIFTVKRI